MARDVGVAPVRWVVRCIGEHDALGCPPHVVHDGRRQVSTGGGRGFPEDLYVRRVERLPGHDAGLAVVLEDEEAFAGAGVLDQDAHQLGQQPLQVDLAADGLRRFDDGDEVDA